MSRPDTRASSAARAILAGSALLLPTLSLLPLGSLWLWENGYLLWWAVGSALVVTLVYVIQLWLLSGSSKETTAEPASLGPENYDRSAPNPVWNASEERAWRDVEALARKIDIDALVDMDAVGRLGHLTIKAVAHRLHPEKADALWEFTVPEALAISERVSRRLSRFVNDNIPFGDRLTISQVLAIYRWRSAADFVEKAYDVWRLVRLANPAAAITHEARERLSKAMVQWGRAHVTRQLAETFVYEVGRAAIDLYGGRLRISSDVMDFDEEGTDAGVPIALGGAPLRVLVAGATEADRTQVVELIRARQLERVEALAALLRGDETKAVAAREVAAQAIAAGLDVSSPKAAAAWGDKAYESDVVIWLAASDRGESAIAQGTREAIRAEFRARGGLLPPTPVLAEIDRGSGNAARASQPNASSVAARMLGDVFGEPLSLSVNLRLDAASAAADADALMQVLARAAPKAERVQLVRRIERLKNQRSLTSSGWQALSATGSLAKSIVYGLGSRLRG